LHALRERGVEYVEVRLMDINPFEPIGISASTMRMLDIFLLHCLLTDSPLDTPEEIEALKENQLRTAERGREPGLRILRGKKEVLLTEWAHEILTACHPIAQALDATHGSDDYSQALLAAHDVVQFPHLTPSARVLDGTRAYNNNFQSFGLAQTHASKKYLLGLPRNAALEKTFAQLSRASIQAQREIEKADTGSFEEWRLRYMDVANLL
jgi:glutamate--cysteine ligase